MKKVVVKNLNTNIIVAHEAVWADNFLSRLQGLMGRKAFNPGEGLILFPCQMVHSFGMRFAIDLLFVSPTYQVVNAIERLTPYKVSPWVSAAQFVLELPMGQIKESKTEIGHRLAIYS
ncbi:MAG: DUF192 domain-containing protein [Syntrophomonadaceae bacterium]|jgi:uncharacterized membrane protein (UPF0127 family)